VAAFALPGRSSGVTSYQHPGGRNICPRRPLPLKIRHHPLFRGICASGMWAMAAVKQTSHQLIASAKRQVTIIPLTALLSGGR